jgi:hypothetical protein
MDPEKPRATETKAKALCAINAKFDASCNQLNNNPHEFMSPQAEEAICHSTFNNIMLVSNNERNMHIMDR